MKTIDSYERKAIDFAAKHKVKLTIFADPEYRLYWPDDKYRRYVFKCRLSKDSKHYTFTFGQSITNDNQEPNIYDILACLTKYDPGTFEDFCSDYGYDADNPNVKKTYRSVVKEWKAVERLFGNILEELREIEQ